MVSSSRPRTPSHGSSSTSPPSATDKLANISDAANAHPPRRSSLGLLLRRSKSGEFKPSKKQQAIAREQELERQQREAAAIPKSPPRLPDLYNGQKQPTLPFGGGDDNNNINNNNNNNNNNNMRPDSVAIVSNRAEPYQHTRSSMDPGRSASGAAVANVPIPPIPSNGHRNGAWVDPYARTESMTHRGRYSYASSAVSSINSPRRVRRRRDPTPFNILIIGARSSGKTSFLNFLKTSLALPQKKKSTRPNELHDDIFAPQSVRAGKYESHYLETEIEGERIGLTIWDSEGLEKNVVDLQLREMSTFLESKFEETFTEEMKVVRAPGVQDTHIHCAFLLLDPLRLDRNIAQDKTNAANGGSVNGKYNAAPRISGGLDEDLDLQVLRTLQGKTTVVPVISKADTITTAHMNYLKKTVWDSLRQANLDPLEALGLDDEPESPGKPDRIDEGDEDEDDDDDDDEDEDRVPGDDLPIQNPEPQTSPRSNRLSTGSVRRHKEDSGELPYFPLSVISPDIYEPGVIGRKFPWGFADPLNAEHCDFVRLKEAVFTEWRGELREASRDLWYEQWRTSRLKHRESRR